MPRIARKNLTGEYFHVMVQGINREFIFKDDDYKKEYKRLLKSFSIEFHLQIIAYIIMGNHVHVLFHCDDIRDISQCMHNINTIYGIFYNQNHNRIGYVFRDRFKIQSIKDFQHLLNCIVYIHKNPINAHIVSKESNYRFSSFNEYLNKANLININTIKILLGENFMEQFINLHHLVPAFYYDYELLDVDEPVNFQFIIKDFFINGLSDIQIVKALKNHYHLSQDKISEYMHISRYAIRKYLNT